MSSALVLALVSCSKHDLFDENTITGNVGPEAYWEIESAAVNAGGEMGFTAQYYSSVSQIERSEVWYDIMETVEQNVTCPLTATFTHTQSSMVTDRKRVSQLIKEYPHLEEYKNDSLRAYELNGTFPVSGTLAPFVWKQPAQFDSTMMVKYFGEGYMQAFKEAVHAKMKFSDYKKMYIGLGILDDFTQYTDSTLDPNQGQNVYVYHFPKNAEGEEVVPEDIKTIWDGITFEQLINNTANGYYEVDYKRSYSLNAILRVYDVRGIYGKTESKKIDIN